MEADEHGSKPGFTIFPHDFRSLSEDFPFLRLAACPGSASEPGVDFFVNSGENVDFLL